MPCLVEYKWQRESVGTNVFGEQSGSFGPGGQFWSRVRYSTHPTHIDFRIVVIVLLLLAIIISLPENSPVFNN